MTPKEQYEARKAERAKLKDLEYQVRHATETLMLLDTFDRFVTAVERIADAMTPPRPTPPSWPVPYPGTKPEDWATPLPLCGCKPGTACGNVACPYRPMVT